MNRIFSDCVLNIGSRARRVVTAMSRVCTIAVCSRFKPLANPGKKLIDACHPPANLPANRTILTTR
jgi:hypothetical protein